MKIAGTQVTNADVLAAWAKIEQAAGADVLVRGEYVAADGSKPGVRFFYVVEVKAKTDNAKNRKAGTVGDPYAVTVTADERGEIVPVTDDEGNVKHDEDGNPLPKVRSRNPLSFVPKTVRIVTGDE